MRKFLFLDVDGVLTTTSSPNEMVPSCVERLERVLVVTGAAIVVSSSWRLWGIGPSSELQAQLRRICREMDGHTRRFDRIAGRLVGATARLYGRNRQREVEAYVARHAPDRFAAVDDWTLDFSSPPPGWLVLTDPDRGLDEPAVARLVALLGEIPAGDR